jgi:hypothetical protein
LNGRDILGSGRSRKGHRFPIPPEWFDEVATCAHAGTEG